MAVSFTGCVRLVLAVALALACAEPAFAQDRFRQMRGWSLESTPQGLRVRSVDERGRAAMAGFQEGDVIRKVNGDPVSSARELEMAMRRSRMEKGGSPTIEVLRDGKVKEIELSARGPEDRGREDRRGPGAVERGGLGDGAYLGLTLDPEGRVTAIDPAGPASELGLEQGDTVTHYGLVPLAGPEELARRLSTARPFSEELLTVTRGGKRLVFTAELAPLPGQGISPELEEEPETEILEPADEVTLEWSSIDEARARAEETRTPVLVKFSSRACGSCKALAETTLADPAVRRALKDVALAEVVYEEDPERFEEHEVVGFPTLAVWSPRGDEKLRIEGFVEPDELLQKLTFATRGRIGGGPTGSRSGLSRSAAYQASAPRVGEKAPDLSPAASFSSRSSAAGVLDQKVRFRVLAFGSIT